MKIQAHGYSAVEEHHLNRVPQHDVLGRGDDREFLLDLVPPGDVPGPGDALADLLPLHHVHVLLYFLRVPRYHVHVHVHVPHPILQFLHDDQGSCGPADRVPLYHVHVPLYLLLQVSNAVYSK